MDEAIKNIEMRIKNKRNNLLNQKNISNFPKPSKFINKFCTQILISIILVLSCAIYVNISADNLSFFKNKLFQDTLLFVKINNLYAKYFGDVIPNKVNQTTPVFNSKIEYAQITKENNSYKLTLNSNVIHPLESGIIVFMGEKDNLGNTLIVQGVDGVDIWYSNISFEGLTLYDYIEKDTILGNANSNNIYLTFMKDGNFIGYENYLS